MQVCIILDPTVKRDTKIFLLLYIRRFFESVPNAEFVSRLAFYSVLVVLRELFNRNLITMFKQYMLWREIEKVLRVKCKQDDMLFFGN